VAGPGDETAAERGALPIDDRELVRAATPVHDDPTPSGTDAPDEPRPGTALCLSGGGYRAMLFHLGTLWRLNETGYLQRLTRVSSVSGGSITAGVLGLRWSAQRAYGTRAVLSDGGVYENLGLQTAWSYRTVLVSDGGGHMAPQERPHAFWPLQFVRVLKVIDNQVRSLRRRQLIDGYKAKLRSGAYWGIRSDISHYQLPDALPAPYAATIRLAEIPTRLQRMETVVQERLINWGYAVCDAGLRKHVDTALPAPAGFPYPSAGVG
jgi:hypothetical protein